MIMTGQATIPMAALEELFNGRLLMAATMDQLKRCEDQLNKANDSILKRQTTNSAIATGIEMGRKEAFGEVAAVLNRWKSDPDSHPLFEMVERAITKPLVDKT